MLFWWRWLRSVRNKHVVNKTARVVMLCQIGPVWFTNWWRCWGCISWRCCRMILWAHTPPAWTWHPQWPVPILTGSSSSCWGCFQSLCGAGWVMTSTKQRCLDILNLRRVWQSGVQISLAISESLAVFFSDAYIGIQWHVQLSISSGCRYQWIQCYLYKR